MSKLVFHFEVEVLDYGRREKGFDTYYRYMIKTISPYDEKKMLAFCRGFLKDAVLKEEKKSWAQPFISKLEMTSETTWIYEVTEPNTD